MSTEFQFRQIRTTLTLIRIQDNISEKGKDAVMKWYEAKLPHYEKALVQAFRSLADTDSIAAEGPHIQFDAYESVAKSLLTVFEIPEEQIEIKIERA